MMASVATLTLTEFLMARLDEDAAYYARDPDDMTADEWADVGDLNEAWIASASVRLLAEVEAKRQIVDKLYREWINRPPSWRSDMELADGYDVVDFVLQTLALPYADHPEYREEWPPHDPR